MRRDWMMAVALFAVALAMRLPVRSEVAYHWDSAQFALAVTQYNVALGQPHAPGYFLYVMLGRLVNVFVGDAHAALVWISVVCGSALPVILYGLGTRMFNRRAGLAAGSFALTSPQVWFHSEVALTYVVDAVAVCLFVLAGWRAMERQGRWRDAVLLGALGAVVGGIRPQTGPALVPIAAYFFWNFAPPRAAKLLVAAGVAAVGSALWLVPMIAQSGGLPVYLEVLQRYAHNNAPDSWAGGGWRALYANCFWALAYCWNGLLLVVGLLGGALWYRLRRMPRQQKATWDGQHARALTTLGWWIGPLLVFGTMIQFTVQPGQVLSYLPAGLLAGGLVAAQIRKRHHFVAVTATVAAVNALVFLAWPARWDGLLFHVGRTARVIRHHDDQLKQVITTIRGSFSPADTVVCHAVVAHFAFGMRLFQLHLPEFDHYQLAADPTIPAPVGRPLLRARLGKMEFVSGLEETGQKRVVLVVPPGLGPEIFERYFRAGGAQPVAPAKDLVYELIAGSTVQ